MLMSEAIPDWQEIDTVLLDMDGTLLDLHFDTYFWLEHVPLRYAERRGMAVDNARHELMARYRQAEGTLDWYCVDYWTEQLGLDIPLLKEEVDHLIEVRPDVIPFLESLARAGKRRILVTNAHGKSLALKMRRTPIGAYLDEMITSHDIGLAKEQTDFWSQLQQRIHFDRDRTLLIDDSIKVLRSAHTFGIRHLRAILQPDSRSEPTPSDHFIHIERFSDILPNAE
jgi:putative hydrolase of the HAD superfamily